MVGVAAHYCVYPGAALILCLLIPTNLAPQRETRVINLYQHLLIYWDLEWLLLSQQAVVKSYRARYHDINFVSMLQIEKYLYNKCTRCILAQLLSSQNDHIHCNFYSSVFSSLTLVKICWNIKSRSRADWQTCEAFLG